MLSNGKCKVEMEGSSMMFLSSVVKGNHLVVFKSTDVNWAIVPDEEVAH